MKLGFVDPTATTAPYIVISLYAYQHIHRPTRTYLNQTFRLNGMLIVITPRHCIYNGIIYMALTSCWVEALHWIKWKCPFPIDLSITIANWNIDILLYTRTIQANTFFSVFFFLSLFFFFGLFIGHFSIRDRLFKPFGFVLDDVSCKRRQWWCYRFYRCIITRPDSRINITLRTVANGKHTCETIFGNLTDSNKLFLSRMSKTI